MTVLQIKVTPNASTNQIVGWKEEVLAVRVKGVPEKGKVNEELIAFLSKELGIPKSHIEIAGGKTARLKRLKIEGLTMEQLKQMFS